MRINVDLDCGEGSPYLSADFHAESGGETIDFEELKFLRGAPAAGRLIPGKGFFKIADADAENFSRAQRTLEFFGGKIPRYMMFTLFDEFSRSAVSKSAEAWRRGVLSGSITPKLADFLRPYQKDAVSRMSALFSAGCGMLLADEMGLGKTVQTLSFIDNFWDGESNFLIVCPASVIPVWRGEAAKFFPKIKCAELAQPSDLRGSKGVLWISSYTQLRRNKQKLDGVSFHTAVLDEAQYIKNPDSKASAACMSIKAGFRLALTGTPIENRLLDMWSIFRWLMPGLLGSRADFEKRLNADRDFPQTLKRQLAPFVLRRVKREVLAELPAKNYVDLLCPMSAMQAQEYEKLLSRAREAVKTGAAADAKGRAGVLSLITRLRQASCDPALLPWIGSDCPAGNSGKISALSDALSGIIESGSKAVVFSQFTKFLDRIKGEVKTRFKDAAIFELNGAVKDRSAPVDGFQNAAGAAVIFVSLRAGGTGITLTGADYVF
ncbi:MAG: DEAD/DEAH box helicase, partial [Opitutales bacterium]|nr:DEAD/DEAH box helicase [Opitutales bacterium]